MNTKTLLPATILIALFLGFAVLPPALHAEEIEAPPVASGAAILVDARSGRVLFEKNAEEKRAVASATKMLTGIVAIEAMGLDEEIIVSHQVADVAGARSGLQAGQRIKVNSLLHALLLESGNDVAHALASQTIEGGIDAFIARMNDKALELGATDSHFKNPHGLDEPGHYSTAKDLALIGQALLQNETLASIVQSKEKAVVFNEATGLSRTLKNRNRLLWNFTEATGIKTGYTSNAGFCLTASAKRDDVDIIAVVLGARSMEAAIADATRLLDHGLNLFHRETLFSKGEVRQIVELPFGKHLTVIVADDVELTIRKSPRTVKIDTVVQSSILPPINQGQVVGSITVEEDGVKLAEIPLVADKSVGEATFWERTRFYINRFFQAAKQLLGLASTKVSSEMCSINIKSGL